MSTAGKVIRCKAAVLWKPNTPFTMEEIEVDPPKDHEVRIKIIATGVCGSDDHIARGRLPIQFPIILGHEAAGIVESVGEGVTCLKPGDKVIPLFLPQCGQCRCCRDPRANYCDKTSFDNAAGLRSDGTSRFRCKGQILYQLSGIGSYSQYTLVDDIAVAKIRDDTPMDEACLIGCGFTTGYGAAVKHAQVFPGATCVVFGLGGIGLCVIKGCKVNKAARIIGVDVNSDKFAKAKELGATECINSRDCDKPIHEVIQKMTNGGADFAFECVGRIETMESTFKCCFHGSGTAVLVGIAPAGEKMTVDPGDAITGRILTGAIFGGYKSRNDVPNLAEDLVAGKFTIDDVISHKMSIEEINKGFDLLRKSESTRTIMHF